MNFVLIGSAGYIAERHMKAIKALGHNIIACHDQFDVMGKIDSYFPESDFFTDANLFYKFISDNKKSIDYLSVCTPNDKHLQFIIKGLCEGINVICEKPMVTRTSILDRIKETEEEYNARAFTILQLRHHPAILKIRQQVQNSPKKYKVNLKYITSRGKWYFKTWKADPVRSGGLTMNIGIHFFDMLLWIFGKVINTKTTMLEPNKASGVLELELATVDWFLSIDKNDLPVYFRNSGQSTFRSITVDGKEIEFSDGFTDLHTVAYENIINGNGYGVDDIYDCISLVNEINKN